MSANIMMLDPTQLLIEMLSHPVPKKTKLAIREKIANNECLGTGCKNKIWRNGVCRACEYEIESVTAGMNKTQKAKYMESLHHDGLVLYPYEIRDYRKPESEYRRRA